MKNAILFAAPFPALVFFKLFAGPQRAPETLMWVTVGLALYCLAVVILAACLDRPTYFDWTILVYFVCLTLAFWQSPRAATRWVGHYGASGVYATLFCSAVIPLLLKMDPFSMHWAKRSTPREFWEAPDFKSINLRITLFWAALFATGAGLALIPSPFTRAVIPLCLFGLLGVPFTLRYPDWHLKRRGLPTRKEQQAMVRASGSF